MRVNKIFAFEKSVPLTNSSACYLPFVQVLVFEHVKNIPLLLICKRHDSPSTRKHNDIDELRLKYEVPITQFSELAYRNRV